jgi:hypothetical protein
MSNAPALTLNVSGGTGQTDWGLPQALHHSDAMQYAQSASIRDFTRHKLVTSWHRAASFNDTASTAYVMRNPMKNKNFWLESIAYFPWYNTSHIENDASNNSSIVACIRYRGNVSTEPLPSNDRGDTQTRTHRQQRDLIKPTQFFQNKGSGLKSGWLWTLSGGCWLLHIQAYICNFLVTMYRGTNRE